MCLRLNFLNTLSNIVLSICKPRESEVNIANTIEKNHIQKILFLRIP